jgi:hypothetical protein
VKHLTPLLAAAALLIGGAYTYAVEETVPGVALLAAGLVVLGAWVGEAVRWKVSDDMHATIEEAGRERTPRG